MTNKLIKLIKFELISKIFFKREWIYNSIFFLIFMVIFSFTHQFEEELKKQIYIAILISSMVLTVVLSTHHIFNEDNNLGMIDQLISCGVKFYQIYLCKIIVTSIEFILTLSFVIFISGIFYEIDFYTLYKLWIIITSSIPILCSISVFGSLLTINSNTSTISFIIIFPLFISSIIIMSLAAEVILNNEKFDSALNYIGIEAGLSLIIIPTLVLICRLVR